MYRFHTIVLETPFVSGYNELQIEIDRLVGEALAANGNCQLVNVQVSQLGEKNSVNGIFTIFLYTVEVLIDTEQAQ